MKFLQKYKEWINSKTISEEIKSELTSLKDEKEIEDRFYKELDFGTAGLRGIIGQELIEWIHTLFQKQHKVMQYI